MGNIVSRKRARRVSATSASIESHAGSHQHSGYAIETASRQHASHSGHQPSRHKARKSRHLHMPVHTQQHHSKDAAWKHWRRPENRLSEGQMARTSAASLQATDAVFDTYAQLPGQLSRLIVPANCLGEATANVAKQLVASSPETHDLSEFGKPMLEAASSASNQQQSSASAEESPTLSSLQKAEPTQALAFLKDETLQTVAQLSGKVFEWDRGAKDSMTGRAGHVDWDDDDRIGAWRGLSAVQAALVGTREQLDHCHEQVAPACPSLSRFSAS